MTLIHMLPMGTQAELRIAYVETLEQERQDALNRYLSTADEKALNEAAGLQKKIHAARAELIIE